MSATKHVIDCDATPLCPHKPSAPSDLFVFSHCQGGQFEWDPDKITLWVSKEQKYISVSGLYYYVQKAGRPLSACVLDYLLEHPELIPKEWEGRTIFFWGTIYHSTRGSPFVRYLCGASGWWKTGYEPVSNGVFAPEWTSAIFKEE